MKNQLILVLCLVFMGSCVQKLIDKPDNLISQKKITNILYDLAVLNAVKNTNSTIFTNNGIEPMSFLFSKYDIDSLQFVESNRYYASQPEKYEQIYTAVNEKLKSEVKRMSDIKKVNDSLKMIENKATRKAINEKSKEAIKKATGTLQ